MLNWFRTLIGLKSRKSSPRRLSDHPRWKGIQLNLERLEDRTLLSGNPVLIQQVFGTVSASTSSTTLSVVPGFSTPISLASAQTVDISSILQAYKSYGDPTSDILVGAIFVDGTALYSSSVSLTPNGGYNVHEALPQNYVFNLLAGAHTIAIEWKSENGDTINLDPGESSLTITAYDPLPGAAAPVAIQQASAPPAPVGTTLSVVPQLSRA